MLPFRFGKPVYYLLFTSLLLLLVIQGFWLHYTWQWKEKDFDEKVRLSLRVYGNIIQEDSTLVKNMRAVWYDTTQLKQTTNVLRYSIDTFFTNSNIPLDYAFAIGRSRGPVYWASDPAIVKEIDSSQFRIIGLCMDKLGSLYVVFTFPAKTQYILGNLLPLLALSAFSLLLLIACFIHLAATIRRQRKLSEMKNDFINNMTHELKTPLFTISIASRMMSEQPETTLHEKNRTYLQSIRQETARLNNLVESVLETAGMQQQQLPFEKEVVDFHEVIRQAVISFKPVEWQREGKISAQFEATTHHICANPLQISNMLHNLLDNAFKYTLVHPRITLSTANKDNQLIFCISDNGIGLDKETRELIFERFYRVHTSNTHAVKGYGIGLSYVRSVVMAHGGAIEVKSTPGKGSTFIIQLPFINHDQ